MKRFLQFLNSVVPVLLACVLFTAVHAVAQDTLPADRYTFSLETDKAHVSGVFLAREDDGGINGSMINEFGVSAVDFTYSKEKQKIRLLNVVSFLDKWYIRKVLSEDLRFCLHVLFGTPYKKKHGYGIERDGATVAVTNPRRGIRYTFTPLEFTTPQNSQVTDDTEEQSL